MITSVSLETNCDTPKRMTPPSRTMEFVITNLHEAGNGERQFVLWLAFHHIFIIDKTCIAQHKGHFRPHSIILCHPYIFPSGCTPPSFCSGWTYRPDFSVSTYDSPRNVPSFEKIVTDHCYFCF